MCLCYTTDFIYIDFIYVILLLALLIFQAQQIGLAFMASAEFKINRHCLSRSEVVRAFILKQQKYESLGVITVIILQYSLQYLVFNLPL